METSALPIFEIRDALLAALRRSPRLILTAPTGSGKSTQTPQMLLDGDLLGAGQVVVLQPRRLATRLLAGWVARQRNSPLGGEVGYQIRLDNVTSPATRIRYVTEGVLLRQLLAEPTLPGVQAVIFDEFHERHLYGDITLARVLQLQETARPDLRLVVMSATLETGPLQSYLAPCETLASAGRAFPVTIEHLSRPVGDYPIWDLAAEELERLMRQQPAGDALIFMPGAYEISRTVQRVQDRLGQQVIAFPLHGELAPDAQDAAVARYDRRKVVVATNVAETSLTIDGVRIVIDSGLARIPRYDPQRGINTLLIETISRASAEQRAGRAGRTAPGHCLRLWTAREHESRPAHELPEVKRLDLAEVVLTLHAGGVTDPRAFRWFEPPDSKSLDRAEQLLGDLGALSPGGSMWERHACRDSTTAPTRSRQECRSHGQGTAITALGRQMLAFPLHPRYARMLLAAADAGCVRQVALIAALTQGRDLLVRQRGKQVTEARDDLFGGETQSDLFVLMRAWRYAERNRFNVARCRAVGIHAQAARQVGPVFEQFLRIAQREGLDVNEQPVESAVIQRCVLAGFSDQVAQRLDKGTLRCALAHGRRGTLARESVVTEPLFVAAEVAEIEGRELNVILSLATAVREEWLRELFPADFARRREVTYDATLRRVVAYSVTRFRELVLEEKLSEDVPPGEAARLLAAQCALPQWDDAVEQWIRRVNRLRDWMPELGLPAISDADRQTIREQICYGALSFKEVKDRPVWPAVKGWLSAEQQAWVEQFVPERFALPNGRRAKIAYPAEGPPVVAALIKDLYEVKDALWIAQRRVKLTIQILAPNHRPVQVTDDLSRFWREMYPQLKLELQRKYPRHEWR